MCEYLRGGAGEGPSGTAGRPSSLPAASDPPRSVTPSCPGPEVGSRRPPAGPRGRAARRVQELRLQPAAVPRPPPRRPGHPDVAAAVPGGHADQRHPQRGRHRRTGQRGPRPVPRRRPGPLHHHRQAAAARPHRRPRRPRRPAHRQPAARPAGPRHPATGNRRQRRRGAAAAAVPLARRPGRRGQRRRRGLVAPRDPSAGHRARPAAAGPGDPADRVRPVGRLGRVPRVRARDRLPLRRRPARARSGPASTWSGRRSSPTSPTPTGSAAPPASAPTWAACTST